MIVKALLAARQLHRTEAPGASAIWQSHSMSMSCPSCLAGTGNYSRLAQRMLPVLDFGTGKNVLVINTGHGIQVTASLQSAASDRLPQFWALRTGLGPGAHRAC